MKIGDISELCYNLRLLILLFPDRWSQITHGVLYWTHSNIYALIADRWSQITHGVLYWTHSNIYALIADR